MSKEAPGGLGVLLELFVDCLGWQIYERKRSVFLMAIQLLDFVFCGFRVLGVRDVHWCGCGRRRIGIRTDQLVFAVARVRRLARGRCW